MALLLTKVRQDKGLNYKFIYFWFLFVCFFGGGRCFRFVEVFFSICDILFNLTGGFFLLFTMSTMLPALTEQVTRARHEKVIKVK